MRGLVFFELEQDGPMPKGPFIALANGADVSCHAIEMPVRVPLQARRAIAYRQLEARLSLDDTELFSLTGATDKEPWSHVLAVNAAKAVEWRTRLASHGAQCRALIPDYLALPVRSGVGTLWVLPNPAPDAPPQIAARLSETSGFRAEWDLAQLILSLSKALPETLEVSGALNAEQRAELDRLPTHISIVSDKAPSFRDAAQARRAIDVDLLEDDAARLSQMQKSVRRWSLPAALVVLATAAWFGTMWHETETHQRQLSAYDRINTQIVRQYFVPNGPLLDLRKQVERVTTHAGQQWQSTGTVLQVVDPMPLLKETALGLAESNADVGQISFSAPPETSQPRVLSVEVRSPSFADVEVVLDALRARSLAVTVIQSTVDPEGAVQSQLQVSTP